MSAPITRLYVLVVALFALLIAFTSRWTAFDAQALRDNPLNRRALLEEQRIHRGLIKADDGTVLARSRPAGGGTYRRTYPTGGLFSHAVGYSFISLGRSGLEQSRNAALTGQRNEVTSLVDQLSGKRREGDDVQTTLDPTAQKVAINALGGRRGAVVALEPSTGRIKVMASVPDFDPNQVPRQFRQLNQQDGSPLFNRVTQAGYPPGSTFKVVTAIAAIDSGRYTPDSVVSGANNKLIGGVPLRNDAGEDFGPISLTQALTQSVNTVWAEVGETLGKRTMAKYMTRLGFYAKPPLDYPPGERRASGEYCDPGRGCRPAGELLPPTSRFIDVGRMAIGQDQLAVTPLQMAMVASAVANDGKLVGPHLTRRVVDPDGRVVSDVSTPSTRVMKKSTADAVAQMMSQVVKEGTGTAAALSGVEVAGKTGTAEIDVANNITQPWFIAFAPIDKPRYAIAATVERSDGGFGGTIAAPIAKSVLESLLGGGSQSGSGSG